MRTALLLAPLLLTGCLADLLGDAVDRTTLACDLRDPDSIEPRDYCQEWRCVIDSPGSDTTPRALCASMGAAFHEGGCPSEGIIAGCYTGDQGDGGQNIWWFYDTTWDGQPATLEDAEAECEGDGEIIEYTEPEYP